MNVDFIIVGQGLAISANGKHLPSTIKFIERKAVLSLSNDADFHIRGKR